MKTQTDYCKEKLILLMAEIGACQETYKEELACVAKEYPLNQAIFVLSQALLAIKKKEEGMHYKITKDGLEIGRKPTMRDADAMFSDIANEQPAGTKMCRNGNELIVTKEDKEIVYRIEYGT